MRTKILMFSMLAAMTMFTTNSFADNNNTSAEKAETQKVDQDVVPRSDNHILFENKTGEGQGGTIKINFSTMSMTFSAAADEAARTLRLYNGYKNYTWKNQRGEILDFDKPCTAQGVYHGSVVTVE